ncbi:MAG: Rpn family recombination-promoting nuclease/putative transposase [Spirochaetaceae bacterium]|nr:Rpn family recombination-promoting nuclease/putative transposase [Spirochaetaceae bacterium]
MFKTLFTDESEEANQALTCFLSDILGKTVTDVVLQPNELSGESDSDRQSEFDINCKIDGKIANIEMQGENDKQAYGKRAEYHAAHVLNHYTPKGMDWDKIPQVFQISVLNFVFDKDAEKCINHYVLRNDEGRTISNTLNVIFMELPKIKKLDDDISRLTKAQMWGKFFLYASIPEKADYVRRLTEANGGIKMAFTVLKNVSQDELNWYHETRYWMHVSDEVTMKNAAKREGIAEGEHKKAVEAAITLIKKYNATPEAAAADMGISLDDVLQALKTK